MANVLCASGRRVWIENEIKVAKVKGWQPDKGKTGKGILQFTDAETGQHRAVDLEDVVSVNPTRTITRKGRSLVD